VTYAYTRRVPSGSVRLPARVDASLLASGGWPVETAPVCYVCGPTGFVELVARLLVDQGHPSLNVKTERFGPTGRQ
jgi:ferredoxin-NADP reductase